MLNLIQKLSHKFSKFVLKIIIKKYLKMEYASTKEKERTKV